MDRRHFLRALLGTAALGLVRPGLGRALSSPADRFAQGLADHPWLAGWQDAPRFDHGARTLEVIGKVPDGLNGTLYRNGPGRFSRAGQRYEHWFDGDGLLHAWRLDDSGIGHRASFVGTRKFEREEAAGRFLLPAIGSHIEGALPIRNSDDLNTANTAVFSHAGRLYALWEGGSAYEIDPVSLQALGPKAWRDDLRSMPFSAHPLREADGSSRNFGLLGATLVLWHLGPAGDVRDVRTLEMPFPGYMHAFSMTERYLVFVLLPYVARRGESGQPYFKTLHWEPERGCRALVIDKADLNRQRWYALPAGAAYHYGPARQSGRDIALQACWNRDGAQALSPFKSEMQGKPKRIDLGASLQLIRLGLDSGRADLETRVAAGMDFPAWDERAEDGRMFALTGGDTSESGYFDAVASIVPDRGIVDRYNYGDGCLVEEHRFVPSMDDRVPGHGWLLGTVLDYRRGRTGLSILQADNLAAGPVAQAWLPYTVPLGFHGWFEPANRPA